MKQVIIVRRDLRMRRAEVASYVARASSRFLYENSDIDVESGGLNIPLTHEEKEWFYGDQKVIVLGVQSGSALMSVIDRAEMQGLTVAKLERRGDFKFDVSDSIVCAAIGPHDDDTIDSITGNLRLM